MSARVYEVMGVTLQHHSPPPAPSLVVLNDSQGLHNCLQADSSQISISTPDLPPELQVRLSTA